MIIDISNEVLTEIKNSLSKVDVYLEYPQKTPKFPCVTFRDNGNTTHLDSVDTSGETHNEVSFEINIFSNGRNKVTQAKAIRDTIDGIMAGTYNMQRDFADQVPNFANDEIFRYILRYSCVVDKTKRIYRR